MVCKEKLKVVECSRYVSIRHIHCIYTQWYKGFCVSVLLAVELNQSVREDALLPDQ